MVVVGCGGHSSGRREGGVADSGKDGGGAVTGGVDARMSDVAGAPQADGRWAGADTRITATGERQFTIENVVATYALSFVPRDKGLVFVDKVSSSANWRIRYLSFATGASATLTRWSTGPLMIFDSADGILTKTYPIDPTGCFLPIDSDLETGGGRLALLPE